MKHIAAFLICLSALFSISSKNSIEAAQEPAVQLGADRLFSSSFRSLVEKKKVGLITNQTGVLSSCKRTCDLFIDKHEAKELQLAALFAPEHGLFGEMYAGDAIKNASYRGIPIYSLYGITRRPTTEMLKGIEVLVYDIQDIGCRSYTFASTLYYCMEEAAKRQIRVVVLDRPNPLGGIMVDGPMLEPQLQSFVGYVNVPYCHGMTIGELARFFNTEYEIHALLTVVPMIGWTRSMQFSDTGLVWIPTSPNIPEASTTRMYPTTGLLGELGIVNIGIGYTLPFKVVAAPFINAKQFVAELNRTSIPGVRFQEIWIKPYFGRMKGQICQGALILPSPISFFPPVQTSYWICDVLKRLYPKEFISALSKKGDSNLEMFYKVCGTKKIAEILIKEPRPFSALCRLHAKEREIFLQTRARYLIPSYKQ